MFFGKLSNVTTRILLLLNFFPSHKTHMKWYYELQNTYNTCFTHLQGDKLLEIR
jgi:hypothetical protein